LALADLRWIGVAVIALVLVGAFLLLWPKSEQTVVALCRGQYDKALTLADTQRVDDVRPLSRDPRFTNASSSCGFLRQAGRL
jgi:transposase